MEPSTSYEFSVVYGNLEKILGRNNRTIEEFLVVLRTDNRSTYTTFLKYRKSPGKFKPSSLENIVRACTSLGISVAGQRELTLKPGFEDVSSPASGDSDPGSADAGDPLASDAGASVFEVSGQTANFITVALDVYDLSAVIVSDMSIVQAEKEIRFHFGKRFRQSMLKRRNSLVHHAFPEYEGIVKTYRDTVLFLGESKGDLPRPPLTMYIYNYRPGPECHFGVQVGSFENDATHYSRRVVLQRVAGNTDNIDYGRHDKNILDPDVYDWLCEDGANVVYKAPELRKVNPMLKSALVASNDRPEGGSQG